VVLADEVSAVLAFDAIQWVEAIIAPLMVALIVGLPAYLTARRNIRENRSQHGDNGDKLDLVRSEVSALRDDLGNLSDRVDRFVHRTEDWRDHTEDWRQHIDPSGEETHRRDDV
jgi:hypothetical protein